MTTRYGKRIRKKLEKIEKKTKRKYKCPSCSRKAVRRIAAGIWECKKCKKKFASGAYEFE